MKKYFTSTLNDGTEVLFERVVPSNVTIINSTPEVEITEAEYLDRKKKSSHRKGK